MNEGGEAKSDRDRQMLGSGKQLSTADMKRIRGIMKSMSDEDKKNLMEMIERNYR